MMQTGSNLNVKYDRCLKPSFVKEAKGAISATKGGPCPYFLSPSLFRHQTSRKPARKQQQTPWLGYHPHRRRRRQIISQRNRIQRWIKARRIGIHAVEVVEQHDSYVPKELLHGEVITPTQKSELVTTAKLIPRFVIEIGYNVPRCRTLFRNWRNT
jgi:hypothetical protein